MKINPISIYLKPYTPQSNKRAHNNHISPLLENFALFHNYSALLAKSSISFCGNENNFKEKLEKLLNNGNEDELFLFIDSSLRNRAREKKITGNNADDVVQSAILEILLLMQKFNSDEISKDELLDGAEALHKNLRLSNEDYYYNYKSVSLNQPLDDKRSLQDIIPNDDEHKINYLSKPDAVQKQKARFDVENAVSGVDLTQYERDLLRAKYTDDDSVTYSQLARVYGISTVRMITLIRKIIKKIQISNNALPQGEIQNINEFIGRFNKEGLTYKNYLAACLRHPQLFSRSPDTMESNVRDFVEKFKNEGLTVENYLTACLKHSQLFVQSPDTIEGNVRGFVKKFEHEGLTVERYLAACIKHPQLFSQSPDTIEGNVRDLVKKFKDEGLTVERYLAACLKHPQLLGQSPDNVESHVKGLVKKFENEGLTVDRYLTACLRHPQLFGQSPNTIESNVRDLVKKFENDGLTVKKHLLACLDIPQLFSRSSDSAESNVRDLVKKFENDGLTVERYLPACLKRSQLFYQSPDTIESNVRDLVKKFKDEGLTVERYLAACLKHPQLFVQSPDTVESNVRDLVKKFESEGLTVERYLGMCLNNASLFSRSPDSIENNFKAVLFLYRNLYNMSSNSEPLDKISANYILLGSKPERSYDQLLRKRMIKQNNAKELKGCSRFREKIINCLRAHPDVLYKFSVINDELTDDFIKYTKNLAIEALGRDDVFDITVE